MTMERATLASPASLSRGGGDSATNRQAIDEGAIGIESAERREGRRHGRGTWPATGHGPWPADATAASRERRSRSDERRDRRGFILRRLFVVSDLLAFAASWALVLGLSTLVGRHAAALGEFELFAAPLPPWLLVASSLHLYHLSEHRFEHTAADEL